MKILLIHNYYGSAAPSGENQVFEAEHALLQQRGHTVSEFTRHSDEIRSKGVWGAIQGACAVPWNPWSVVAIRRAVDTFRPAVVHVHNTFPLISPGIFHAIGPRAARVLTLHNYRLFCPAAIPMRAGQVCTDCLDRHSAWPALRYGCYRNRRLATVPLALSVGLHRILGTWTRQVDAFIALTEFQRDRMIAAGLPAELVHVKPNFYPGNPTCMPWADRRPSVVFAGRLTAEKGGMALVRAWLLWGAAAPELRIVGDGDLRGDLERLAATHPATPIRFLGSQSSEAAQAEIAHARLLVLPSEWFEGFPMVVREAFAFGTPAAVSAIGPLPSIVQHGNNGVIFTPANPESLFRAVRAAWETPGLLERLGQGARQTFEMCYIEGVNHRILLAIYQQAIAVSQERKSVR
ncbi:MAG: glycosyltransferase family 4 protein [Candidatus Contendobacter sp.]|nr:glycosyltransferase family 4 protein [Candidatus Contendobacter sp.]